MEQARPAIPYPSTGGADQGRGGGARQAEQVEVRAAGPAGPAGRLRAPRGAVARPRRRSDRRCAARLRGQRRALPDHLRRRRRLAVRGGVRGHLQRPGAGVGGVRGVEGALPALLAGGAVPVPRQHRTRQGRPARLRRTGRREVDVRGPLREGGGPAPAAGGTCGPGPRSGGGLAEGQERGGESASAGGRGGGPRCRLPRRRTRAAHAPGSVHRRRRGTGDGGRAAGRSVGRDGVDRAGVRGGRRCGRELGDTGRHAGPGRLDPSPGRYPERWAAH